MDDVNSILSKFFGRFSQELASIPPADIPNDNEQSTIPIADTPNDNEQSTIPPADIPNDNSQKEITLEKIQQLTDKFTELLESKDTEINTLKEQLNTIFKQSPTPKENSEPSVTLNPEEIMQKQIDDYLTSADSITNKFLLQYTEKDGKSNGKF